MLHPLLPGDLRGLAGIKIPGGRPIARSTVLALITLTFERLTGFKAICWSGFFSLLDRVALSRIAGRRAGR